LELAAGRRAFSKFTRSITMWSGPQVFLQFLLLDAACLDDHDFGLG